MKTIRFIVVVVFAMSAVASAQWLKYPTAGIPRTADGKPDLTAPTPRHANGKPVLAGLWRPAPGGPGVGDMTRGTSRSGEVVPFQPWAETLFKQRRANNSRDDPTADASSAACRAPTSSATRSRFSRRPVWWRSSTRPCTRIDRSLPTGATLPEDPNPAWFGYSVGRWDGDVFVVETRVQRRCLAGQRGPSSDGRLACDRAASCARTSARWTSRSRSTIPRRTRGRGSVTQQLAFQPDTELLEYICNENNKYFEIIPKLTTDR